MVSASHHLQVHQRSLECDRLYHSDSHVRFEMDLDMIVRATKYYDGLWVTMTKASHLVTMQREPFATMRGPDAFWHELNALPLGEAFLLQHNLNTTFRSRPRNLCEAEGCGTYVRRRTRCKGCGLLTCGYCLEVYHCVEDADAV